MAYTATSLADLTAFMQARWDASVFWTPDEARLALNEALRDWNLLTGRWRKTILRSTSAGIPEVALLATLTYAMRVKVGTATVHPTSIIDLDLGRPSWRGETTASGGDVPTVPTFWAPLSLTQISIWPSTVGAGVNNLQAEGVAATPVLTEAGDFVDLGEEIVDIIVDYAIHVAAFKEGGPRWKATRPLFVDFLQAAAEENSMLKTKQAFRRIAGLDRKRDLARSKGATTKLDAIAGTGLPPMGGGAA